MARLLLISRMSRRGSISRNVHSADRVDLHASFTVRTSRTREARFNASTQIFSSSFFSMTIIGLLVRSVKQTGNRAQFLIGRIVNCRHGRTEAKCGPLARAIRSLDFRSHAPAGEARHRCSHHNAPLLPLKSTRLDHHQSSHIARKGERLASLSRRKNSGSPHEILVDTGSQKACRHQLGSQEIFAGYRRVQTNQNIDGRAFSRWGARAGCSS